MTAPESIAASINQIDEKKRNLKKAFDDLQAHRSLLSPSFSLSWSEIDSHFSSLQSSLFDRFRLLQSAAPPPNSDKIEASTADTTETPVLWPELRKLCEKNDGIGLGKYMIDNSKKRLSINLELPDAIRCSKNPAALVLDTIEGSYHCSSPSRAIDLHSHKGFDREGKLQTYHAAKRVCAEGNYSLKAQNEATDKELSALRAVIRVVKEKNLESEFVVDKLEECVKELDDQKAQRRRATKFTSPAKSQQPQQQVDKKRPRIANGSTTEYNLTVPPLSQQQQPLLPNPSHSVQVNPYGLLSSYGNPLPLFGSVPVPAPASQPVYYEQQTGYGGYGLPPQYHPPYYPW